NYLNLKGEANIKEFWLFVLVNIVVSIVLSSITILIDRAILRGPEFSIAINIFSYIFGGLLILQTLYILFILPPLITMSIRVMHNNSMAGLVNILLIIPIVGIHALLNFAVFLTMNI
ncbi:MAG: DUF805 domain-containing protein, partial [Bacteroidales bacterium]|nr:DUF805 domain-containing protein [Bacteroidales bacterium]